MNGFIASYTLRSELGREIVRIPVMSIARSG